MPTVVGFDEHRRSRVTCPCCTAIVEYVGNDIASKTCNHDYLGDHDVRGFVQCPNCNKDIQVRNY